LAINELGCIFFEKEAYYESLLVFSAAATYIRYFVQAGGVLFVTAATNSAQSLEQVTRFNWAASSEHSLIVFPFVSKVCSAPLDLINGVLNADTGCRCSTTWVGSAAGMINTTAAVAVFGANASDALISVRGGNYQLSLSLVAASPMYCPSSSLAAARFFNIFPLHYTSFGV
jgi:hypothetical protein